MSNRRLSTGKEVRSLKQARDIKVTPHSSLSPRSIIKFCFFYFLKPYIILCSRNVLTTSKGWRERNQQRKCYCSFPWWTAAPQDYGAWSGWWEIHFHHSLFSSLTFPLSSTCCNLYLGLRKRQRTVIPNKKKINFQSKARISRAHDVPNQRCEV